MPRLLAALYDRVGARHEATVMVPRRDRLLAAACGTVLEVGAGTGANLARYAPDLELILTEPDRHMRERLQGRLAASGRRAQVLAAPAEQLPVPDASVDTVVATLVFCSVSDTGAVLAEARRVLRPGGRLLFLEHVRSPHPRLARWQDRVAPLWRRILGGCTPNRATLDDLAGAGFDVTGLVVHPSHGLQERFLPVVQGVATPVDATRDTGGPAVEALDG